MLEEAYGPPSKDEWLDNSRITVKKFNDNYRYEANRKAKRRRIYLKHEADATMLLLKVS